MLYLSTFSNTKQLILMLIDIYYLKSSVAGAVSASVEVCNKDLLPKGYFDLAFKYVLYF